MFGLVSHRTAVGDLLLCWVCHVRLLFTAFVKKFERTVVDTQSRVKLVMSCSSTYVGTVRTVDINYYGKCNHLKIDAS